MVLACKEYLRQCTLQGEEDLLWEKVDTEVHKEDTGATAANAQQLDGAQKAQIQAQLDARLRVQYLEFLMYISKTLPVQRAKYNS